MACGPTSVAVSGGEPGTTYYVVAFSDTEVNGGNLSVTFSALPPAPETTLTVDPTGRAFKDGSAQLTGTYSCTNASDYDSDIEGTLTQRVGRFKVNGFFFVYPLMCDGQVHPWEALVTLGQRHLLGRQGGARHADLRLRLLRLRGAGGRRHRPAAARLSDHPARRRRRAPGP